MLSQVLLFGSRRLASTLAIQMKKLNDSKNFQKAMGLFDAHVRQHQPTDGTINQALKACVGLGDLKRGSDIHRNLSPSSTKNPFIQCTLVHLYSKCGDLLKAQDVFNKCDRKTSAIYDVMLNGLVTNNRASEALDLFRKMTIHPSEYSLSIALKMCAQLADHQSLEFGKKVLQTIPSKLQENLIVCNSALNMLMQCGDISSGETFFSQMKTKDSVTYGTMMSGYVTNNMPQKAINLFNDIEKPNKIISIIFFKACAQLGTNEALTVGKQVLSKLPVNLSEESSKSKLLYAILDMYIKCDDVKNAEWLFTRVHRDIICYGSLMKMYNLRNEPEKSLALFKQMAEEKLKADDIIFVFLLGACSQIGDHSLCQSIITQIPHNSLNNSWIQNALINMWGKVGSPEEAKIVFETISKPDAVSFSAMINAYGLNGMGSQAVQLFRQTPSDMIGENTNVCVLNACSHSGQIDEAREIFHRMPSKNKTERVYTTMVDALSRLFLFDEAENMISEFEQKYSPSIPMYMAILSGARNRKNGALSQKIFDRMKEIFPDVKNFLVAAMVLLANTYASEGDFSRASNVRMEMRKAGMKKIVGLSWTVIDGKVVKFRAHDQTHPRSNEIYAELERLSQELTQNGYECDSSWITRPIENDETVDSVLCGHSERLAIALNLIQKPAPSRIQVAKNLRVCGDCHAATKLIARIRQCSIIVRDANRIHHFHPNGECSCGDHF